MHNVGMLQYSELNVQIDVAILLGVQRHEDFFSASSTRLAKGRHSSEDRTSLTLTA